MQVFLRASVHFIICNILSLSVVHLPSILAGEFYLYEMICWGVILSSWHDDLGMIFKSESGCLCLNGCRRRRGSIALWSDSHQRLYLSSFTVKFFDLIWPCQSITDVNVYLENNVSFFGWKCQMHQCRCECSDTHLTVGSQPNRRLPLRVGKHVTADTQYLARMLFLPCRGVSVKTLSLASAQHLQYSSLQAFMIAAGHMGLTRSCFLRSRDFQFGHMDGNDYINSLIMRWVSVDQLHTSWLISWSLHKG